MNSLKKIILGLFSLGIFISCEESPEPQIEVELEKFERFDDFNFKWQNSNVKRIKTIDDRLYYAHRTNPGYISSDMTVNQLCCLRNNQIDFRQSLSKDYIATVDRSLSGYHIYRVDESGNTGFLDLNRLFQDLEGRKAVAGFGLGVDGSFDINGTKMLANIVIGSNNTGSLYIFDLEQNTNFVGVIPSQNVIRVEFPDTDPNNSNKVIRLDSFEDGWIASVDTGNFNFSNYFISKEGTVRRFTFGDDLNRTYLGYQITANGKLIMNGDRHIYISESGDVDNLSLLASINNFFKISLIEDRLVIWHPSFGEIFELENYASRDPDLFKVRKLNNEGMEFSGLNELQVFNGKVFAATSQGLFTKSLRGFWDSAIEPEGENAEIKSFIEVIEFHNY